MEFVIQVNENGDPIGHPMSLENLRYIHDDITVDNLPEGIEPFVRVSMPQLSPYEVLISNEPTYKRVDGVLQDAFEVRPMTDEEKQAKINAALQFNHPEGWEFSYEKCGWRPVLNQPGTEPDVIG